jgi:hypothetical protein
MEHLEKVSQRHPLLAAARAVILLDVATHLLTIGKSDIQGGRVVIGRRLSELHDPAFGRLTSGSPLELVRLDGTRRRVWVVDFSTDQIEVYGRGDDGTVYMMKDDPVYRLQMSPHMTESDAPPGTEVWLLGERPD